MSAQLWIDASAGVAGDMLLAALLDAGADLESVRAAVATVVPGEVGIDAGAVDRAGMAATLVTVTPTAPASHHRAWAEIAGLLRGAELAEPVREIAYAAFAALARAEAEAHGVPEDEVHFHEVGAWDSIADVVGVAAAAHDLGVSSVSVTRVGLGSGTVDTAHGRMPVPVPAVLRLLAESAVVAAPDDGLVGECATPTGVALLIALLGRGRAEADARDLPAGEVRRDGPSGRVLAVGVGAGTRDSPGRANVVRVALHEDADVDGDSEAQARHGQAGDGRGVDGPVAGAEVQDLVELAANVDDLDPRVWPSVIEAALEAGALDAWLVPVHMKKGRPGVVVHVLAEPHLREGLAEMLARHTSTLGVRWHPVARAALRREWREVDVGGGTVRVKIGLLGQDVVTTTPELEDARALAEQTGQPLRTVLRAAEAAAARAEWGSIASPGEAQD